MTKTSKGLPPIETIETGRRWFRVFWKGVKPTQFSHTKINEPPWRFSPFKDMRTGELVQALYMGDAAMAAMAETLFRKDKSGAVLATEVDDRFVCQLRGQRDFRVAVLSQDFLMGKLGFDPIMTNQYGRCRDVAKLLYHFCQEAIDGLVFPSYQSSGYNANLMVFSTRVKPSDFRMVANSKDQVYSDRYRVDFQMAVDASDRLLSDSLSQKIIAARVVVV